MPDTHETTQNFSLYLHFPYCEKKCPYCDFNSHLQNSPLIGDDFYDAYLIELQQLKARTDYRNIDSIFWGGGTPSLMSVSQCARLLDAIAKLWHVPDDCEITLEANPSSAERDKLTSFYQAGINRLSLGVQSFDDEKLKFLGRVHDADDAVRAIEAMMTIFPRSSFDLIYGLPDENLESWQAELYHALTYAPSHLSCYQLTIEPQTHFYKLAQRGKLILPESADFMKQTIAILSAHDLPPYEISNYAKAGDESQHNLTYWLTKDYAGIGPGAHSRITRDDGYYALANVKQPALWQQKLHAGDTAHDEQKRLDFQERALEKLLMGLRLKQGVTLTQQEFDMLIDPEQLKRSEAHIIYTQSAECHTIQLNPEGWLFLDTILCTILRDSAVAASQM